MNSFSQLLTSFITEKNVTISQMAVYCSVNRSTMYKIVHGTRKPLSADLVLGIARFLNLSPEENELLQEKYQMLLVGEENYLRRKTVCSFLRACFKPVPAAHSFSITYGCLPLEKGGASCGIFRGKNNIVNVFGYIAQQEMKREQGCLQIRMQPDDRFSDVLRSLGNSMGGAENLQVIQIIAFKSGSSSTNTGVINLNMVSTVLPVFLELQNHSLYYYHTNVYSEGIAFSFLPYAVISHDFVLQVSEDMEYAVLHTQKDTVLFFKSAFRRLLGACSLLSQNTTDLRDLLYNAKQRTAGAESVSFQMYPCLNPVLTRELLEKYIRSDAPQRGFLVQSVLSLTENDRQLFAAGNLTAFASVHGLRKLAENGLLPEFYSSSRVPVDENDRRILLRSFLEFIRQHSIPFRIIKEEFGNTASPTAVWLGDSCAFFLFQGTGDKKKFLMLRDPEILADLRDFFSHIPENLCHTREESLTILQQICEEKEKGNLCDE